MTFTNLILVYLVATIGLILAFITVHYIRRVYKNIRVTLYRKKRSKDLLSQYKRNMSYKKDSTCVHFDLT